MPRPFASQELLDLGTAYYERNEYQKAIDAFTKVIVPCFVGSVIADPNKALSVCDDASRFKILDRRAATFERMYKLESALNDGKTIMKKDKSQPSVCQNFVFNNYMASSSLGLYSSR